VSAASPSTHEEARVAATAARRDETARQLMVRVFAPDLAQSLLIGHARASEHVKAAARLCYALADALEAAR